MKRDERIKSEALKKAREVYMCNLCSWKQNCEFMGGHNTPYDCTECAGDDFRRGFEAGVKWVNENPKQGIVDLSQFWRDAEEEPNMSNKYIYILYVNVDNVPRLQLLCDILEYHDYEIRWEDAVERSCIAKWAYMADLLLKGG